MKLWALDLGNTAGYAEGLVGEMPSAVHSVSLKRGQTTPEGVARNLGCFLRDRAVWGDPDLICVEHYMQPAGQPSDDVTITHMLLHGALLGFAGPRGIRVEAPYTQTVTKHFCGQATAKLSVTYTSESKRKAAMREAKKRMVLARAITLGMLPRTCTDFDKADACALFDFAAATYARRGLATLVMFGATA